MFDKLIQLIILYFVIFDPLASFAVFTVATEKMKEKERKKTALTAVFVAAVLSFSVLFFGNSLLSLFSTNLNDFKVAGGIILAFLGIKMTLGHSLENVERTEKSSAMAIASVIATPLLTGPAAITSIIISSQEYGMFSTGIAVAVVLAFVAVIFYQSGRISKLVGKTPIQVSSTILGLITISWGVKFVREGMGI